MVKLKKKKRQFSNKIIWKNEIFVCKRVKEFYNWPLAGFFIFFSCFSVCHLCSISLFLFCVLFPLIWKNEFSESDVKEPEQIHIYGYFISFETQTSKDFNLKKFSFFSTNQTFCGKRWSVKLLVLRSCYQHPCNNFEIFTKLNQK